MKHPQVNYHEYLKLDQLLASQTLKSEEYKQPAHDEMLFIVVHQTYELWFKQMLFELDSALDIFSQDKISDSQMGALVARLERVVSIQQFINGQIDILETMTPLDFLDFRDFLYPASGFQSYQWRLIETKLGLRTEDRLLFNNSPFFKSLQPHQQTEIQAVMSSDSLFDLIEKWLERTPFLKWHDFDFWQQYKTAVLDLMERDRKTVADLNRLTGDEKQKTLSQIDASEKMFLSLFAEDSFKELQKLGFFRLSQQALQAALLIQLYREQPILQMPFRIIQSLIDIDEQMTQWRYRHSLMAHRMLGKKIGTGGSSGHDYLKAATEKHKIFGDFFNLTTFFIPRRQLPSLPEGLLKKMNFPDWQ